MPIVIIIIMIRSENDLKTHVQVNFKAYHTYHNNLLQNITLFSPLLKRLKESIREQIIGIAIVSKRDLRRKL